MAGRTRQSLSVARSCGRAYTRGVGRLLAVAIVGVGMALLWSYWSSAPSSTQGKGQDSERDQASEEQSAPTPTIPENLLASSPPAPIRMRSDGGVAGTEVAPQASAVSLADAFAKEAPAKSPPQERLNMIREVVADVVGAKDSKAEIHGLECRERHCLLKISGDDANDLLSVVDALQDERGFLGRAQSLMMSRDAESIHLYLRFPES